MNLAERENELFERWEKRCNQRGWMGFARDGAVDPEQFEKSPLRIVFVLKESRARERSDLREWMREHGMYKVLCRWVVNLDQSSCDRVWKDYQSLSKETLHMAAQQIAVVNARKEGGGGPSVSDKKIQEALKLDGDLLREQLKLYKPDAVIWCGKPFWRHNVPHYVYGMPRDVSTRATSARGVVYFTADGALHVLYYHPGYRVPHNMLHYGLMDALEELAIGERWRGERAGKT